MFEYKAFDRTTFDNVDDCEAYTDKCADELFNGELDTEKAMKQTLFAMYETD